MTFTPKAFDLVHSISGGVPRMINLVCDRALMVACEKQSSRIAEEDVVKAAGHLGQEIPKGKIKGEKAPAATTSISRPSRRSMIIAAAIVLVVAIAAAAIAFVGNPIALLSAGPPPATPKAPARAMPMAVTALPAPADMPEPATVPPPMPASFSIVVGTYDNARDAQAAEAALREQKLTPYTIDILMAPEDVQRRLLLGRFVTREEAEAAREKLGPLAANARVIPGAQERARVILP